MRKVVRGRCTVFQVLHGRGHRFCAVAPHLRARAARHRGTCSGCVGAGLRGSSSQLLKNGLFSTSVILHFLGRREVPFRFFGLDIWATESKTRSFTLTLSTNSWSSALVADSRTREHFLNLSVVAEGCDLDAVRHPPVPTNKNFLQSDGVQTSSMHCGMFSFYRKRQTTPWWPRTWSLSLLATGHILLVPKRRVFPTRSVPLRRSVQALVVCFGCRLRLRVPLHHATNTHAHLLGARDIECHISEHQHSLRQDCLRLDRGLRWWCRTVCSLSQSSTAPIISRPASLWNRQTPQKQLHVDHRIFDRLAAFVRQ